MTRAESIEVADIFRKYGHAYRVSRKMPLSHIRTMRAIERCRTAELGGHIDECDCCGRIRISYNSCRNRHCPKCQFLKKEKWLEERKEDILFKEEHDSPSRSFLAAWLVYYPSARMLLFLSQATKKT